MNTQKQPKQVDCTLFIAGMHCASCEVLIEKKLLEHPEVESVDASLQSQSVHIITNGKPIDISKINKEFKELGYTFSSKKHKEVQEPLFIQESDGTISINMIRLGQLLKPIGIVILFLIAFFLVSKLELGKRISVTTSSSLSAFWLLGLVAGVSSCAALVGGLLLSLVKQWNELYITETNVLKKSIPHTLFHVGRLLTFPLLGGVLGMMGSSITLGSTTSTAILTILVSIVMSVLGLQMLEVGWAQKLKFAAPKSMTRYLANENNFKGRFLPFLVGASTFFLPCGFTLIAQGLALTSGSFIRGAAIMLAFSLGTFIPLVAISMSGVALNRKPHLTARFNKVAGLLILFFALYNVNGQMNVLGFPSLNDIRLPQKSTTVDTTTKLAQINDKGQQIMTITASGFSYVPTSPMNLKADVPTLLTIDNKGIQGCGSFMTASGLFPGLYLKPGINTVEFTPKKGVYKITCTMGMVPPVTVVVK